MYMRKDWMQAVGAELKDVYTIDELIEIARLFKEKDPGNLGADLLPMSIEATNMGQLLPQQIYTRSIREVFYKGGDGKYHWGPADEQTLEGLRLYKQIYDEGLLDPEFYTLEKSFGDQYKFYYEGNVGMVTADGMAGRMTLFEDNLRDSLELNYDDVVHLAQMVGNDGKYHQAEQSNYWASVIFSPTIEDKVFERSMDMIDLQASPEGQRLVNMGFEGIDWEYDADGGYVNLLEDGQSLSKKYPSANGVFGASLCLGDNFAFESPASKKEYRDAVAHFYQLRDQLGQDNSTFVDIDYDVYFYSSPARNQATMVLADEYAQLILMPGDLETNWRNWVNDKMLIIQPVLDELNEAFAS
jgi:putative aldouronate transport system substrate-binding protein